MENHSKCLAEVWLLWSVRLTASVFPEPVCAIPTMSWPLRATGKPWAWMAVGSLKFWCIRTSITYSDNREVVFHWYWCSLFYYAFHLLITSRQSRFVHTHEETAPGERRWRALNSHCLWLWFPSSCETPPLRTDSCVGCQDALCRSSSQIWAARRGSTSFCGGGHPDFQTSLVVVHCDHSWRQTVVWWKQNSSTWYFVPYGYVSQHQRLYTTIRLNAQLKWTRLILVSCIICHCWKVQRQ